MAEAEVPASEFRRYWIFQGMPDRYDLEKRLNPGEMEPWPLTRHRRDVSLGDIVYFWRGGRRPGLHGWGVVTGEAQALVSEKTGGDIHVPVEYRIRFGEPLSRDELVKRDEATGALSGLLILRAPQGTNFKVTDHEAIALNAILRERGDEPPPDPMGAGTDEWPARSLLPLNFSRSTARVVGAGFTPAFDTMTGVSLFHVLMALPYAAKAPPRGIVLFLREFFAQGEFDPGALLDTLEKPIPLAWDALGEGRMSAESLDIAEAARLLAIQTTGSEEISLRHLFGGILLAGKSGLLDMIDAECVGGGRTIDDLVAEFADFVVDAFPKDESATWLSRWRPAVALRLADFRKRRIRRRPEGFTRTEQPEKKSGAPSPEAGPPDSNLEVEPEEGALADLGATGAFARVFAHRPLTDRPSGYDLLKIEQEVRALAHLFALCDLQDPAREYPERDRATFALGLFGRWGAGKSFFINKLKQQIETFSDEKQKSTAKASYCERIVQIDFNAWHYNEADIWASLVHHIFDSLQKFFAEEREEKEFKNLISRLDIAQQQREEIERDRRAKCKERWRVARDISRRKKWIAKNVQRQMSKISMLGRVAASPELRKDLVDVLSRAHRVLGLPQNGGGSGLNTATDSAQELLDALQESGALAARSQSTARTIMQSTLSRGFLIVAGLALVAYVGVPYLLDKENLWEDLLNGMNEGFVAAVPVMAWIGAKLKQTNLVFDKITGIETKLREQIRQDQEKKSAELETLRQNHTRLDNETKEDAEKLTAVDDEIRAIEARLDELGSPKSLVDFINNRATSDDYRSKLGILALIRSDFEKLSGLMTGRDCNKTRSDRKSRQGDENREAQIGDSATVSDEKGARGSEAATGSAEKTTEKEGSLPHLDRIILYIDDLDRVQQSGKVLQVLEAVHLLLAFPLFHVVVAVDERWAARSVMQHHKAFFELPENHDHSEDEVPEKAAKAVQGKSARAPVRPVPSVALPEFTAGSQSATPREFLEKIFQICFWVRPLSTQLAHELINGMVRGDMPPLEREKTAAGLMAGIPHLPVTVGGAVDREPSELGRVAEAPAASTASEPFTVSTAQDGMAPVFTLTASPPDMGGTTAKADDKDDVDEAVHPPPTSADFQGTNTIDAIGAIDFAISEEELISMRALSRVIGRSPRTVKRFINTYRLFKAMRIPPGAGAGLTEPHGPDDIAAHHLTLWLQGVVAPGRPPMGVDPRAAKRRNAATRGEKTRNAERLPAPTRRRDTDAWRCHVGERVVARRRD